MIKVTFKNLEKSDLARQIVLERMDYMIEKFPELDTHSIAVTLSMDNSSMQAGPDEFGVRVHIKGKKYRDLIMEKRAGSLYVAMANVNEAMLEMLNRRTDKLRIKYRSKSREAKQANNSQSEAAAEFQEERF